MAWPWYDEDPPPTGDDTHSATDTNIDSLFNSYNGDETDTTSSINTGYASEINNNLDNNVLLFDNEL